MRTQSAPPDFGPRHEPTLHLDHQVLSDYPEVPVIVTWKARHADRMTVHRALTRETLRVPPQGALSVVIGWVPDLLEFRVTGHDGKTVIKHVILQPKGLDPSCIASDLDELTHLRGELP